ncbi:MAG: hypothetical protein J0L81_15020 [Caulobacterales bacterium]|jgi:hypothetical protein|nr:hypothetical protein [Caulobacterales bacterium]
MWANDDDKIESLRRLLTLSREIAMMLDVVDGDCRDDILDGIGAAEIGLMRAVVEESL